MNYAKTATKQTFAIQILAAIVVLLFGTAAHLQADEVLFIGNSYTFGGLENAIRTHGGIPKLLEVVAASKARNLSTVMLTAGGKDWGYHLKEAATDASLTARKWDFVVLQDFSTKPTHMGDLEAFYSEGVTFYKRIREQAPQAKIVLFETWAREKGHALYTGVSTPKSFVDPAQMDGELQSGYTELQHRLEGLEPGNQVRLAPVGAAFSRCLAKYPDINLHWIDKHHASIAGSYLAALVFYATIFQDSPKGATREFFGISLEPKVATELQEIADEVAMPKKS